MNAMEHQYSISEAKNRLTAIIHGIEPGKPAHLTRHGKPVAVLLSIAEYEALKQRQEPSFWDTLMEFRKSWAGDETCFDNLRDDSQGRYFHF